MKHIWVDDIANHDQNESNRSFMMNPNGWNWQNTTQENGDSLVNDGGTLTNLVV